MSNNWKIGLTAVGSILLTLAACGFYKRLSQTWVIVDKVDYEAKKVKFTVRIKGRDKESKEITYDEVAKVAGATIIKINDQYKYQYYADTKNQALEIEILKDGVQLHRQVISFHAKVVKTVNLHWEDKKKAKK